MRGSERELLRDNVHVQASAYAYSINFLIYTFENQLVAPEPWIQTASQSIQPILHYCDWTNRQTERPTDHATRQ